MPTDSLTLLRDAIGTRLSTDTSFSDAPVVDVINEEAGDLEQRIAKALGKLGVLCVVPTPTLAPGELNRLLQARCRVDFFENVLLNRKGTGFKTSPEMLICALNLLRNDWTPPAGEWQALEFKDHTFEVKGNAVHHTLHLTADLLT